MFKKIIMLIAIINIVGCDTNKQQVLTEEIVSELLNKKVNDDCYYTTFDIAPNVQFNTTLRYWDEEKNEMVNSDVRDIVSIPADSADTKKFRMRVLEKTGMFEKIKEKVYVGSIGISGYYVDPIEYKENKDDKEFIEKTREGHGFQYKLTEKGFNNTFKPNKGSDILFCLGKVRIDKFKIHPLNDAGEGRTKVTFTTRVIDSPEWLMDKEVNLVFPKLINESKSITTKTRGAVYIILNNRNEFIIENDSIFHY